MNMSRTTLAIALAGIMLQGCGADEKDRPASEVNKVEPITSVAIFDPAMGGDGLPFPVDLFLGGTPDGTINIPGKPNHFNPAIPVPSEEGTGNPDQASMVSILPQEAFADPQTVLNTMDGFSTVANMVIRFSAPVDADSIAPSAPGQPAGILLVKAGGSPTLLKYGVDYIASVSQGVTGMIIPLRPLDPDATYIVAVTNKVASVTGDPLAADDTYLAVKNGMLPAGHALYTWQQMVQQFEAAAVAAGGVAASDIILSYSVTTQNTVAPLQQALVVAGATLAAPEIMPLGPSSTLIPLGPSPRGGANLFQGLLQTVQFVDPTAPNTTVWKADASAWGCTTEVPASQSENLVACNGYTPAVEQSSHTIPVAVSVPANADSVCASTGMPVVIFQHGITANRASLMAVADSLAQACAVGVAIDLPKHGIRADSTLGGNSIGPMSFGGLERLVQDDCTAGAPVDTSGAALCPSGDNFINLAHLANSRDTMRQAVVDLDSLYRAVSAGGLDAAELGLSTATLDGANVHFVGMSLGGIVGAPFVALHDQLATATFNVSGGGVAKVLDGSPTIEAQITAGLAQKNVMKPGGDYEGFMLIAQTVVDSVDPVNWVEAIKLNGTPVLIQEVVGNSNAVSCLTESSGCPDMVVPNNVFGPMGDAWGVVGGTGQIGYLPGQNAFTVPSALAGTDPLAQGTGFLAIASAAGAGLTEVLSLGPVGQVDPMNNPTLASAFPAQFVTYKGLELKTVTPCGASEGNGGIVRFTSGEHSSLLDPSISPAVTAVMQKQVVAFVGSGGTIIANDDIDVTDDGLPDMSAGVVFQPPYASLSQAECPSLP